MSYNEIKVEFMRKAKWLAEMYDEDKMTYQVFQRLKKELDDEFKNATKEEEYDDEGFRPEVYKHFEKISLDF